MTTTTLTWASSGNTTKTGTTIADLFNNLDTLITSKSGDATFYWQKAGKVVTGGVPNYLLLSRKDASAGRIALIYYPTAPAAGNAAIFDQTPVGDILFVAFFPSGTGTTLSNLSSASGTMCGVDTNAVKASNSYDISDVYGTSIVSFYFDSYDGMWFLFNNPGTANAYFCGAGALLEDTLTGTAVNATFGSYYQNASTINSGAFGAWTSSATLAGAVAAGFRANYPSVSVSKQFFAPFTVPSSTWATYYNTDLSAVLSDPTNNKYFFAPFPLLSQTKGEGMVLKIRQCGYGDGANYPFATYYTTGPVVQALMMCNATAGGVGYPWLTNFKI